MFLRLGRLFRAVGREILVLWYACRNPATPFHLKLAAILLGLYVFSPIDVIPDWLAFLGLVDDVTLLALGIPALLKFVPEQALHEAHRAADGLVSRLRFGLHR
ncbi:YkvA family protein [Noviherbaspirillum sp. ST9]|uniref:YkvA family protein n=1 Tax=Noviherbaspirillum sp. ST9 TaxID=3401606 RepID=UPI003B5876BB